MHLSLYDLQGEEGTAFGRWYGVGEDRDGVLASTTTTTMASSSSSRNRPHPALPSAEDCAFMYAYASGYLRVRDYEHYKIRSYAYRDDRADGQIDRNDNGRGRRSNNRGRHNQIYWEYDRRDKQRQDAIR
jgi:coproporphyrinogen III oxidase-like Fe-S oxidoreductase